MFGREFGALDPREIECKYFLSFLSNCGHWKLLSSLTHLLITVTLISICIVFTCNLSYVILRELDLLKHPNLSLRHLA